ncbi:MAG: hypothetical protein Q8N23_16390 [Archangium sp.]|nr:hypothetical protein [Archangium sp.]MDP3575945.1 hypothetical protein [Archangium sp.]
MKRILLLSLPIVLFAACGPAVKKGCKDTGCSVGSVCNPVTDACETINIGGGSGGAQGGGTGGGGGGTGGGAVGGGGGSTTDGGVDAGQLVVDPFDDGGVFVAGDICTYALEVAFDGGTTSTVSVDLAAASNQYKAVCNSSTGDGNDLVFAITLSEPKGLIVTATDTSGNNQDGVLALLNSPCALLEQAACADNTTNAEVLTVERLPAGTWYVLLENYADDAANDGTYDVQFELVDPVAGPANDRCSAAQALTFTNGAVMVNGSTAGAFNDTFGQPLTCSAQSALAPEVFYTFTLTQPQDVVVTVEPSSTSNLSPVIALTTTCGVGGAPHQLGCDRSAGAFTARSVPAGTYFLVVDGDGSSTGDFTLTVTLSPPTPPPMNDTCANPATLVPNVSQMVDANAALADYTFSCAGPSGGDVVYQFTTTMAQKVTVTATGTGGADGVISLRAAPCDDDTNELGCIDDAISSPEVLTLRNVPAGTYYVVLSAYSANAGQFGVDLVLEPPVLPPSNDTCSAPATLVPNMSQTIDLAGAIADYGFDCAFPSGGDAVYQFTTTQPQRVVITATGVGDSDAVLALRSACTDATSELRCANAADSMSPEILNSNNLPAGTWYVILGSDGVDAQFGIELSLQAPIPPPTNESCTLPQVVTLTAGTATRTVDLTDAQADIMVLCNTDPNADGADVVYEVTIPAMQTLTVDGVPVGTALDPMLFASYPVCAAPPAVCVDGFGSGVAEQLTVQNTTAAPLTVFVVVKAYNLEDPGAINLTFTAM